MGMNLPKTIGRFRKSRTISNRQADVHARGIFLDFASKGPINTLTKIDSMDRLFELFENGRGPSFMGACLALSGGPQYFVRVQHTAGTVGISTKAYSPDSVGTIVNIGTGNATLALVSNGATPARTIRLINPGVITATTTVAVPTPGNIEVTLRHDGTNILATGEEVRLAISLSVAAMALLASVGNVGTGASVVTAIAVTPLPFGSTGTLATSGTPNDQYLGFKVKVVKNGTVGGASTPAIQWRPDFSAGLDDDSDSFYTSATPVPVGGVVNLTFGNLVTGVTVTLANVLAVGDYWTFSVVGPTVGGPDLLAAIDSIYATPASQVLAADCGFITSAVSVNRSLATQLDTKLHDPTILQNYWQAGFFGVRNIAEGVPGETHDQWADALNLAFLGFDSDKGLEVLGASFGVHNDPLTGVKFERPITFAYVARRTATPVHTSLIRTDVGTIAQFESFNHNEAITSTLIGSRFVTPRMDVERPGEWYFSNSQTFANSSSDSDYARIEKIGVGLICAKIAKSALFAYRGKNLETVSEPDTKNGVVKGGLAYPTARRVETDIGKPIMDFLFEPKTDGEPSGQPYTAKDNNGLIIGAVQARSDYDFESTQELRVSVNYRTRPAVEGITFDIGELVS